MALFELNDKAPPRWSGPVRVGAGIVAALAYFGIMRGVLHRGNLPELNDKALAVGVFVSVLIAARFRRRRGASPGLFARIEDKSFGAFIDRANKHTPMAKLVGLGGVGVALALFLDLGVLALIPTGDPEHALPLSIPAAVVFDLMAVFAGYQIWRKRRTLRSGR